MAKEAEIREVGPTGSAGHSVSDKSEFLSCKGYLKTGCAKDTMNFSTRGANCEGTQGQILKRSV